MKTKWSFRVWGFIAAVYCASALLWLPIYLSGQGMSSPLNMLCMALIAFVPSGMGILFTYLVKSPPERRDFWQRALRWPKVKLPLLLAGLALFPALNIGAYTLTFALLGKAVPLTYARQLFSGLPVLLQFLLVEITFGPISEELGWRGYLLDEIQSRWNALTSALVLGVFWGLWHTPAFLVPGLAQYQMGGVFSAAYLSFVSIAIMASVLQTWMYNRTKRSTLVAGILMHFLTNASLVLMAGIFDSFSIPDLYWFVSIALYGIVTTLIVALYGPRTLAGHPFRRVNRVDEGADKPQKGQEQGIGHPSAV